MATGVRLHATTQRGDRYQKGDKEGLRALVTLYNLDLVLFIIRIHFVKVYQSVHL